MAAFFLKYQRSRGTIIRIVMYEGDDMDSHLFVEVRTTDVAAQGSVRLLADIYLAQQVTTAGRSVTFCLPREFWRGFQSQLQSIGHIEGVATAPAQHADKIRSAIPVPARLAN